MRLAGEGRARPRHDDGAAGMSIEPSVNSAWGHQRYPETGVDGSGDGRGRSERRNSRDSRGR
jgi:hypothetical protein